MMWTRTGASLLPRCVTWARAHIKLWKGVATIGSAAMSVTVVSARVKYQPDKKGRDVHAVPRGLCVHAPKSTANRLTSHASNISDSSNTFLGISMAPTLTKSSAAHIGVAVAGVCTAVIKYPESKRRYHMGTLLKVDGTDSTYLSECPQTNPDEARAIYLQSNGPDTALVWVTRVRSVKSDNLPTTGLVGDGDDEGSTTTDAPLAKRQRISAGVRGHSSRLRAAAQAAFADG